jgi:hypothetical protein
VAKGLANPTWKQKLQALPDFQFGDSLAFAVYSKDHNDGNVETQRGEPPEAKGELLVTIKAGFNLRNLDSGVAGDLSDPYVAVEIGQQRLKTPTISNNLNPVWLTNNQFKVPFSLTDTKLRLAVMNSNYIKDQNLGRVDMDLQKLEHNTVLQERVRLKSGQGGELEYELMVKWPEPCAPHAPLDTKVGVAFLEMARFYPQGFDGHLPLFVTNKRTGQTAPSGGWLKVAIDVQPRDLQQMMLDAQAQEAQQAAMSARDGDDDAADDIPEGAGVVRVTVLSAKNLQNLDTGMMGDYSDPYVQGGDGIIYAAIGVSARPQ